VVPAPGADQLGSGPAYHRLCDGRNPGNQLVVAN